MLSLRQYQCQVPKKNALGHRGIVKVWLYSMYKNISSYYLMMHNIMHYPRTVQETKPRLKYRQLKAHHMTFTQLPNSDLTYH